MHERLVVHHLIHSLQVGGAERLLLGLAQIHQTRGVSLAVHTLSTAGALADPIRQAGVPVLAHEVSSSWAALLRVARALRAHRPHVLHCHNIGATLIGVPAARLARVPCVIATRHGRLWDRRDVERKFWLIARLCQRVVAVSQAALCEFSAVAGASRRKLVLIPNGAAPPRAAVPPTGAARTAGFTLISVGRLTAEKDFPSLLQAFSIVSAALPDVRLWILGDGAERPTLEALIRRLGLSGSVQLLGMRNDVGDWLVQADLFVLSSVSEGLPVALLEALAVGLPVVVTDVGGMPEVLESSGAGLVVPPRDPAALAVAILQIARHPDRLPTLREAARRRYLERYTLERMADDYLWLYRECLSGAPLEATA